MQSVEELKARVVKKVDLWPESTNEDQPESIT